MSSKQIHGYAAKNVGGELVPFSYDPPQLGENDVRVSVSHCGICHTDIHGIDNYYHMVKYPFVPGHEIVGFVSQVGKAATSLKVGDRVGIGWQGRSCMQCEWCLKGEEQMCLDIVGSASWTPYGGFSNSVVVDHRFAYLLPESMPSEQAAVLMCAGITVFSPLRANKSQAHQKIGIIGLGGLGHLAVQFAKALDYEVTVISSCADMQEEAYAFGADDFIVSSDTSKLAQNEFMFDLILCTASGPLTWESLLETLKKEAKFILVGFPDVNMNSTDLVAHNLSISGSLLGNRATMREMLVFVQEHRIKPMLEIMPMAQVNEALQRVRENKARYRIVLANEASG